MFYVQPERILTVECDTAPRQPTGQLPTGRTILQASIKEPFLNLPFRRGGG